MGGKLSSCPSCLRTSSYGRRCPKAKLEPTQIERYGPDQRIDLDKFLARNFTMASSKGSRSVASMPSVLIASSLCLWFWISSGAVSGETTLVGCWSKVMHSEVVSSWCASETAKELLVGGRDAINISAANFSVWWMCLRASVRVLMPG